ncbi:hypothetical protein DNU24_09595 [Salmonella enterica subsp. salamae]|uniref:Uncharacterized protein n=1 Tax=Salmonella enterica subsp. salamae TaxID=59202 RepID=A0A5Y3X8X0_SALER|nr:hypothetical protein [Salmonella enterica subsp. salamae]MII80705.1 hypothetical protein [Salmonella enterica subsp. salamae]
MIHIFNDKLFGAFIDNGSQYFYFYLIHFEVKIILLNFLFFIEFFFFYRRLSPWAIEMMMFFIILPMNNMFRFVQIKHINRFSFKEHSALSCSFSLLT